MYDVLTISKYIIERYNHDIEGGIITSSKLQKILYFIQAQFLINKNSPAFKDDIEATDYGVFISAVHSKYKVYGGTIIPTFIHTPIPDFGFTEWDRNLIDNMLKKLCDYGDFTLGEIITHQTPWRVAHESVDKIISNKKLRDYFLMCEYCGSSEGLFNDCCRRNKFCGNCGRRIRWEKIPEIEEVKK